MTNLRHAWAPLQNSSSLQPSTTRSTESKEWQRLTFSVCLTASANKSWTLLTTAPVLCWILLCSSPVRNMNMTSQSLHWIYMYPWQFCYLWRWYFGENSWYSYLLQVINSSFSHSLAWLCLLTQYPSRGKPSFQVTETHG